MADSRREIVGFRSREAVSALDFFVDVVSLWVVTRVVSKREERYVQAAKHELIVMLLRLLRVSVSVCVLVVWVLFGRNPRGVLLVVVIFHSALDRFHHHAAIVPTYYRRHLRRQPDVDALTHQVLPPRLVEVAEVGKHHHWRHVAHYALLVRGVPHAVRRARTQPFQHNRRDVRGVVARAEEQRDHGKRDDVCEFVGEAEDFENKLDRDQREDDLKPAQHFDHGRETLDFVLVLLEELCREHVGPEV